MKKYIILSLSLLTTCNVTQLAMVAPKMPPPIMIAPKMIPPVVPKIVTPTVAPKAIVPVAAKAPTTSAKAKEYSVVISVAYDISVINTSATAATLNAITIEYTASSNPNKIETITAPVNTAIPANKGISFHPKITLKTPEQNISAQFQGIKGITINSQQLIFDEPKMGTSPIYIANVNGAWKLTTKPSAKTITTPKKTPAQPKINSTEAVAVPYLKTTHPKLSIEPKGPIPAAKNLSAPKSQVPPMPAAPQTVPGVPTPKSSLAAKASAKAIDQTMAKTAA